MSESTLGDALREAVRQTERQLEGQMALAATSDQRAMALCGTLLVIVAFVLEGGINKDGNVSDIIMIALFITGAIVAAYGAWPSRFYGSGGSFKGFQPYLNEVYCGKILTEIGMRNDDYIAMNDKKIRRSAKIVRAAFAISMIGYVLLLYRFVRSAVSV